MPEKGGRGFQTGAAVLPAIGTFLQKMGGTVQWERGVPHAHAPSLLQLQLPTATPTCPGHPRAGTGKGVVIQGHRILK